MLDVVMLIIILNAVLLNVVVPKGLATNLFPTSFKLDENSNFQFFKIFFKNLIKNNIKNFKTRQEKYQL
jgi:hypothetical protein